MVGMKRTMFSSLLCNHLIKHYFILLLGLAYFKEDYSKYLSIAVTVEYTHTYTGNENIDIDVAIFRRV